MLSTFVSTFTKGFEGNDVFPEKLLPAPPRPEFYTDTAVVAELLLPRLLSQTQGPGMSPALLSLPRPENTVVVAVSTYTVFLRSYKQNSFDQSGGQGEG